MRTTTFLSLTVVAMVFGCEEDPPPPEPTMPTFDVPRVDTGPSDTGATTDVRSTDVDTDRGLSTCNGGFRPCECEPGVQGRDFCVNRMFEGVCRCGDAGPPAADASGDAGDAETLDADTTDGAPRD